MIRGGSSHLRWKKFSGNHFYYELVFIVLIALVFLLWFYRPEPDTKIVEKIVPSFDTIYVPVPRRLISSGEKISDADLELVRFPKHLLPANSIIVREDLADKYALVNLPANYPASNVSVSVDRNMLINPVLSKIPKGMRAMTVRVDVASAVEGWAGTGSNVDVLLVEKEQTLLVAENVTVLSAERSVQPIEQGVPQVPNTVTLLVTQEQCLAISTAIPRGKLSLILRASNDQSVWEKKSLASDSLRPEQSKSDSVVQGVAKVEGQTYALSEGRWIKSLQVPQGFFPASN